jgi:CYTH domain-containing protein
MHHGEAKQLLSLAPCKLQKIRHHLHLAGGDWVVDVFEEENAPLIIAEVELTAADSNINIPTWCGEEISDRGDLSNAALALNPWGHRT